MTSTTSPTTRTSSTPASACRAFIPCARRWSRSSAPPSCRARSSPGSSTNRSGWTRKTTSARCRSSDEIARYHHLLHHVGLVRRLVRNQPDRTADAHHHPRLPPEPGARRFSAVLVLSRLWADIDTGRRAGRGTRTPNDAANRFWPEPARLPGHFALSVVRGRHLRTVRDRTRHGDAASRHQPADTCDGRRRAFLLLLSHGTTR